MNELPGQEAVKRLEATGNERLPCPVGVCYGLSKFITETCRRIELMEQRNEAQTEVLIFLKGKWVESRTWYLELKDKYEDAMVEKRQLRMENKAIRGRLFNLENAVFKCEGAPSAERRLCKLEGEVCDLRMVEMGFRRAEDK